MKILATSIASCIIAFTSLQAQQVTRPLRVGQPATADRSFISTGLSPQTALLLLDLKRQDAKEPTALSSEELREKYGLFDINGVLHANVFVVVDEDGAQGLAELGIGQVRNGIATGTIPVSSMEDLSHHQWVRYVQIGDKATQAMDNARQQTWVDLVHQGSGLPQSYYGDGVVVGIIDQGFDYTHPNFYDETGAVYRIKRVWEQSGSGTPPSGFAFGRELASESAILAAQRDNPDGSHGSHVAGVAAGGGGTVDVVFRGVAPHSDIVLVSTTMMTPAIADGIDYIMGYANSVGKPCVINMSIGGQSGPHDGASAFDQYCDGIVGPGRLLVGAAANNGADALYLGKSYTLTDTLLLTCVEFPGTSTGTNGQTVIDIWGNPGQEYWVGVDIFNSIDYTLEDWTPYIAASSNSTNSYTLYDADVLQDVCQVEIATETYPLNNKRHVVVTIDHTDQDDAYKWAMIDIVGYNVQTKMWAATNGAIFTNAGYSAPILTGSTSSTIGEIGGTGNSIISVGAYTSKNSYTSFSGGSGQVDFPATMGAIAPFSSKGPTADGRTKPDITAPGNVVVSSLNRFDANYPGTSPYVVSGVTDGVNNWWFGAMQGTSMAAPVVTGIMALWLQAAPGLTPAQALTLARESAYTDSHTGSIGVNGSNTWGWGKIDAHQGMQDLLAFLSVEEAGPASSTIVYPNPSTGAVNVVFGETVAGGTAEIYDLSGSLVLSMRIPAATDGQAVPLAIRSLVDGAYVLKVMASDLISTHRLILSR